MLKCIFKLEKGNVFNVCCDYIVYNNGSLSRKQELSDISQNFYMDLQNANTVFFNFFNAWFMIIKRIYKESNMGKICIKLYLKSLRKYEDLSNIFIKFGFKYRLTIININLYFCILMCCYTFCFLWDLWHFFQDLLMNFWLKIQNNYKKDNIFKYHIQCCLFLPKRPTFS